MNTLYLDPQSWDLVLDAAGNIAMAKGPYAKAQDVASAKKRWAKSSRSRCTGIA